MKLTDRDQKLLLFLASFLLLVGAYVFGYKEYGERRMEYEERKASLQIKYDDLNKKNEKRHLYEEEAKVNKEKLNVLLASFPKSLQNQNAIYFTKQLEEGTGVRVSQISYADPTSFYLGNEEDKTVGLTGNKSTSTITLESDYTQFKKVLAFIRSGDQRRVIQQIKVAADTKEGTLAGTISYDTFSLEGEATEEEKVKIPMSAAGQGVPQVFGDIIRK